ncbi:MAG: hypothetical protein PUG85_02230 [Oscillospiraceae bacterium]|nr:hypothetical protein [Oscillospiraceae bacterium]MDY2509582.1 hypothetical protein [Ruminococcus callidus]
MDKCHPPNGDCGQAGSLCEPRKSVFGFLRETISEPSGRFAPLSACVRCPPYSVRQLAV